MARTSLLLRNEHNPLHHPLEVCIKEEQVYLGEGCWSWLGCFSLWFQYLSRFSPTNVSITIKWPELPPNWRMNIYHYSIIWKYVLRKNKCTWERGAGLGWVVSVSLSFICPELHYNCFNCYVMAITSLLLRNEHKPLHHPLAVCVEEEPVYLGEGCWSWLGGCSLFFRYLSRFSLQLFPLLCNDQNFSLIEKFT
jgi:hypothetical protein